jgi:hypothetical protein
MAASNNAALGYLGILMINHTYFLHEERSTGGAHLRASVAGQHRSPVTQASPPPPRIRPFPVHTRVAGTLVTRELQFSRAPRHTDRPLHPLYDLSRHAHTQCVRNEVALICVRYRRHGLAFP